MGTFDLLEAKLTETPSGGGEILYIQGQIQHEMIMTSFNILITDVRHSKDIEPTYKKFDRIELFEFLKGLYNIKDLYDRKFAYGRNSKLEINTIRVNDITD